MRRLFPKAFKAFAYVCIFGVAFAVASHLIFNSRALQQIAINFIHSHLKMDIQWDKLTFNGATGRFKGKNLALNLPKAHARIKLKEFNLVFEPFHLIVQKVHLLDLQALGLEIEFYAPTEAPQSLAPTPIPKAPVYTVEKPKRSDPLKDVQAILDVFDLKRAEIRDVLIKGPNGERLQLSSLELKSRNPILIYKEGLDLKATQFSIQAPKIDLFVKTFALKGDFKIDREKKTNRAFIDLNAEVKLQEILLGANKKPQPWNTSPAWDEALNPILDVHYPLGIPNNRGFAYFDEILLPITLKENSIRLKAARVRAMDGELFVNGGWERQKGDAEFELKTLKPFRLALLPLGRAKIRQAFEKFTVDWNGKGKITRLTEGSLNSKLKIELSGNKAVNKLKTLPNTVTVTASPALKNGTVSIADLLIALGEGRLTGDAELNLPAKTLKSSVSGNNIDTQTAVRFFSDIDIPGTADVRGRIFGDLKDPTFDLDITASEIGYESVYLGSAAGKLDIRNGNLLLSANTKMEEGSGRFELAITSLFNSAEQVIKLKTDAAKLPLGAALKTPMLSGSLDGSFQMTKKFNNYTGDGKLSASNVLWYNVPVQSVSALLELKDKTFTFKTITFQWDETEKTVNTAKPLVFSFDANGYAFEGNILPSVQVQAKSLKSDPDYLRGTVKAVDAPLIFLAPALPVEVNKFVVSGDFTVDYFLPEAARSTVKAEISKFEFVGEEKTLSLAQKTQINYADKKITFNNTGFKIGNGKITLNGPLGFEGGSSLHIKGLLDLNQLNTLQPWLSEGDGTADLDLTLTQSMQSPEFNGSIRFTNASFFLPTLLGEISELNGKVDLRGKRIQLNSLAGRYDDAPARADGWFEWAEQKLTAANLTFSGEEIPLASADSWRVLTDANLALKGSGQNLTLSGTLQIIDGLYYRDYSISQFVLKPIGVSRVEPKDSIPEIFQAINLNLAIKSAGDFIVKNNLADLVLRSDLTARGTVLEPQLYGTIDLIEGEIHMLGINFEDATGFVSFTGSKEINPVIDFGASHEIQDVEIHVKIRGYANNLRLELESTPALPQNDLVSLIAYGQTPDQLSNDNRNLFSTTAVASQVVGMLQRPLSRATRLDIVKLESEDDPNSPTVSRFSIGKRLTDRFSLSFTTDLSLDEAYKGVVVEYLLFDNLLLKGTKDTGSRYRFDLTWRFEIY